MQKEINFNLKNVFLLFILLFLIWFLSKVPVTISIFAVATILFLIFDPLIVLLQKLYNNRALWVIIFLIFMIVILVCSFYTLVPLLLGQLQQLVSNAHIYLKWVSDMVQFVSEKVKNHINVPEFNQQLDVTTNTVNSWLISSINRVSTVALELFSNIFNFVLAVIISVYMLIDKDRIKKSILSMLPKRVREHEQKLLPKVLANLTAYIRGLILLVLIVFVISWPILTLLKVQFSFLFSVWAAVSIIIPYIGPFIGTIPPVVAGWFISPTIGLTVLIILAALQFIVAYILTPKVMEKSLNIHPLWVLFSIIAGGELFGIIGMVIGVPTAAIIITIYRYFRDNP